MSASPLARALAAGLLCAFHSSTALSLTPAQVYAKVARLVVVVESLDPQGRKRSQGSGVMIAAGEVVTNCHVLLRGEQLVVRSGGAKHDATRRYSDEQRDLCQLNVPTLAISASALAPVASASPGDHVFAIGAPQGLELTISDGLISGVREINGVSVLQTTAPISAGSSGGGLFNETGHLVGITTFQFRSGQNLNFAVPSRWIAELPARQARSRATLSSTAFSAEWKAQSSGRPGIPETATYIEESLRAFGRAASLPLSDSATMEVVLNTVAVRDCRILMERELVTTRGAAPAATTSTEILVDVVRLNVRGLSSSLLEPGSGVTLASDPKTPFASRRTLYPAARKVVESAENRFVLYLADPEAAFRVRNAFANLISLCENRAADPR